jgi:Zn-dependent protease
MSGVASTGSIGIRCSTCGSEIAAALLACPGCHRLVHADQLKQLVERAAAASQVANRDEELSAWRSALGLLPAGSKQHRAVAAKIASFGPVPSATEPAPAVPQSPLWKWIVGLGPVGVAIFKLKFVFVAVLANAKFLLLGLTKATTLFSMLLAFGVYWSAWGAWFALGLILSIYVHEMGHVAALSRYGIPATAPMFIPGFGAIVRLRQASLPPFQNARVGLAGPLWGTAAAAAALAAAPIAGPLWTAIAHAGAWINMFNLLPVWQLDGSRAFSALGSTARRTIAAAFGAAWLFTGDGLLALLAIVSVARAFDPHAEQESDAGVWMEFIALIAALAMLLRVSVRA